MITIVSGVPRSGTSLMMQMLAAGGLPILSDGLRAPDADNPRGYLEWEPAKALPRDPSRIRDAEGTAVKVVSAVLPALPAGLDYRVIFLRRPLGEVVASQAAMRVRQGTGAASLGTAGLERALTAHVAQVTAAVRRRPTVKWLDVEYHALLLDPAAGARRVAEFLGVPLALEAMAAVVDPALQRQRTA